MGVNTNQNKNRVNKFQPTNIENGKKTMERPSGIAKIPFRLLVSSFFIINIFTVPPDDQTASIKNTTF